MSLFLVSLLGSAVCALKQSPPQLIQSLPGWTNSDGPFPVMHSGYINVNATYGRHIFYWLCSASDVDPKSAPTVFWYQGGPGSAGEFGLTWELGPFGIRGTVAKPIAYRRVVGAWTKWANVVFLDQPAGVGFSYSNDTNDYGLNSDVRSAQDNKIFLDEFFGLLPQFKKNPFWLSGESYGGVYVPMLANLVALDSSYTNFAGILIGNPVFRCTDNEIGTSFEIVNNIYWRGMMSYDDMQMFWANSCTDAGARAGFEKPACLLLANDYNQNSYLGADFDPDDMLQDVCTSNASLQFAANIGPCNSYNDVSTAYFLRSDVIAAINAKTPNPRPNWQYAQNADSMLPYYAPLIKQNKAILVYSGDLDVQTVPFSYTMACLAQLPNRGIKTLPWTIWTVNGTITAGRTEQYEAYTYATIKGAGHEAIGYQPLLSDQMFIRFITNGTLIDQSFSVAAGARRSAKAKSAATTPPDKAEFIGFQKQSFLLRWSQQQTKKKL